MKFRDFLVEKQEVTINQRDKEYDGVPSIAIEARDGSFPTITYDNDTYYIFDAASEGPTSGEESNDFDKAFKILKNTYGVTVSSKDSAKFSDAVMVAQ